MEHNLSIKDRQSIVQERILKAKSLLNMLNIEISQKIAINDEQKTIKKIQQQILDIPKIIQELEKEQDFLNNQDNML
jgi:hypothetical protein